MHFSEIQMKPKIRSDTVLVFSSLIVQSICWRTIFRNHKMQTGYDLKSYSSIIIYRNNLK